MRMSCGWTSKYVRKNLTNSETIAGAELLKQTCVFGDFAPSPSRACSRQHEVAPNVERVRDRVLGLLDVLLGISRQSFAIRSIAGCTPGSSNAAWRVAQPSTQ